MQKPLQLTLTPFEAANNDVLKQRIATALSVKISDISAVRTVKKTIDARKMPKINLWLDISLGTEIPKNEISTKFNYHSVENAQPVIVVGAGPAGLFAALRLIELGLKPVVLERGKNVRERKKDIALLNRNGSFNINSNYCFGEGGAGAFSDGKLYTRSRKKGDVQRIYEIFYLHGAAENVLYESHPHIGSDKLPLVVEKMMKTVTDCGGEIHFETAFSDICFNSNRKTTGCKTSDNQQFNANAVILATGHSAHDIYELLQANSLRLEAKGFAMGLRVEHRQTLIDSIQYHTKTKDEFLPAATYNLVEQIGGRGVYSFCMCPGGHIVPAASGEGEIVVNGMSVAKRNSPFANAGIVVEIRPEDVMIENRKLKIENCSNDALAGLRFQQYVEHLAFQNNGGRGLAAPAQRLADFVTTKLSTSLPECSYLPSIISSPLHFWLPEHISQRLREGFRLFDRKMHGFLTNDAVVVGVETRSSSPVRIPRDAETFQHPDLQGLFPCGEGAGYSGGITSSAIDGENTATAVAAFLQKNHKFYPRFA